jgi:hypothetical protein
MMTLAKGRSQHGRFSKLTHEQVATARRIYRDYNALLALRTQLCNEWGISSQHFCNVGRGVAGKKPRVSNGT